MTGCVISSDDDDDVPDATLTVHNESDFTIVDIALKPAGNNTAYGRNLIEGDFLAPGEQVTLGADCDTYDARLIDEDEVDCEVLDVDLCLNDADWIIENNTCAVFGIAKAAREAAAAAKTSSAAN